MTQDTAARVMFVSHGGGPLPLLGDPEHQEMVDAIQDMRRFRGKPRGVVVISAHWEATPVAVTASAAPSLLYDYSGFSEQAYHIEYPCPGSPELAEDIVSVLSQRGIAVTTDAERGLDHGVFVPMKLLFPEASVPCVQVSLSASLDPAEHILIGQALQPLLASNVLILGSGFTFHNMSAFFQSGASHTREHKAQVFLDWLLQVSENAALNQSQREKQLIDWEASPESRYNHPREEHLLPYLVCAAAAGKPVTHQWRHAILGIPCANVAWR
ncbi:DODA-type extradiol aromatic ring-opening family dioxygenase [Alteromonas sp. H39]|uniref:DODA-type extradiol aromatic ring-opening family dioxygenase n=1 Tax=Alteromonas sp. H39 TaxID=3389876 RepID=UPI0039E1311F